MFQQYSQHQPQFQLQYQDHDSPPSTPYAQSSVSATSLPCADDQRPTAPAPAHLHRSLELPPETWSCSIHHQCSPDSPSGSSTPTWSLRESRLKSLGNGQITAIGGVSDVSYPSEKNILEHPRRFRDSFYPPETWDSEKASMRYGNAPFDDPKSRRVSSTGTSDDMFGDLSRAEEHAVWILLYLSLFSPILTLPIAIYTLLATPFLLLISLLLRLARHGSTHAYLYTFLAPPVNFQFGLILSRTQISDAGMSNPSMLILIHLLSPVYAMAIALSAWVAAVFWFYAAILGDPDGRDGKDDGRAAVLGVRGWWERWLERGIRDEVG